MAHIMYPFGKDSIGKKEIDLVDDDIQVCGVSLQDYAYDAAHQYRSEVSSYAGSVDMSLTGKSFVNGVFDANDFNPWNTNLAVSGSKTIDAWILFMNTGSQITSPLLVFIDITGAPILPNGSNILLDWDDGDDKIFRFADT